MRPGYLRDRIMAGTRRPRPETPEITGACPLCGREVRFPAAGFSALRGTYTKLRDPETGVAKPGLYPAKFCAGRHTVAELRERYGRLVHPELAPDTIL